MILIGVDQGTTGTRTVAFDARLEPVVEAYRRVAVTHPQPGWISKDADEWSAPSPRRSPRWSTRSAARPR